MRNKFPGPCYRCGGTVHKNEGHFERYGNGWRTQHADCAIKYRSRKDKQRKTIYEALKEKLQREPNHREMCEEVKRILKETL
jgi:hypothetical protein